MLYPERYEYRFLVDGQWYNDPQNDLTCPNCFGTQNNVILVGRKK
ncbi:MAG: glycogen-binding domain-containing protein [Thermodesulfobacteriota bacterium]|nr:glycogen-binding domain-containing protein [Thermodesulfobacteriota bacterium]